MGDPGKKLLSSGAAVFQQWWSVALGISTHKTPGSLWGEAGRPMIKCQDCYSALPKASQVKGYDHCMSSYELCKYTQCVFHFLFKRRTLCYS